MVYNYFNTLTHTSCLCQKWVFPLIAENIYRVPLCPIPITVRMIGFFKQKLLDCIFGGW